MKKTAVLFTCFLLGQNSIILSAFAQAHPPGSAGGGHAPSPNTTMHKRGPSIFPQYPKTSAPRPTNQRLPARNIAMPTHEDHFGNRVSDDHLNRVQFAHDRSENVMRKSATVNNHVSFHSAAFAGTLHPIYERKQVVFTDHFNHFHDVVAAHPVVWRDWHEHRFYGGFYYGFHPIPDVSVYFYNPLVHWFYIGTWDDTYYRTWYGPEYEAYPNLNHAFTYYGVYYPTDNLRQLLFGVSAMPVDKQARFRTGVTELTQQITQQLANFTHQHVVLSNGDIVVTHYETLGAGDGLDVEGSVNFQNQPYNFKGLIDLDKDNTTEVFVTGNGETAPSSAQLKNLDALNHSIDEVRGDSGVPLSATQAPATAGETPSYPAAPTATPIPPSGEVSADPK